MSKKVHIVGSHGLYASYGGWDQLVINLAELKGAEIEYLIFNPKETPVKNNLKDVNIRQLPFSGSGGQGLIFDSLSLMLSFNADTILMLGMKAMPVATVIKLLRPKVNLIINIGGVEWERPQFNKVFKFYLRLCFYLAKKIATNVVIDNKYYEELFSGNITSKLSKISYGGMIDNSLEISNIYDEFHFIDSEYYLSVSRSIEDNKLDELCDMFSKIPNKTLVLISNLSNSYYGLSIITKYKKFSNLILIDGLYDKAKLDVIRRHCKAYIHTHTLCGSAPSLIEMIVCRVPIFSIDVIQNRYTLSSEGIFFKNFCELHSLIISERIPKIPSQKFALNYNWASVVSQYEILY